MTVMQVIITVMAVAIVILLIYGVLFGKLELHDFLCMLCMVAVVFVGSRFLLVPTEETPEKANNITIEAESGFAIATATEVNKEDIQEFESPTEESNNTEDTSNEWQHMIITILAVGLALSFLPSLVEEFIEPIIEWYQDKHQEKNKNDFISDDNYPQEKSENKEEDVTNARSAPIRGFIVQIANLNAEIAENSLSKKLNLVIKTLQAICKLIDNGLAHPSLRRMETYYLPELITLLTYYKKRDKQRNKHKEVNDTLVSIENNVEKIQQALKQIYSEMLETEAIPVNVASSVLDGELSKDFIADIFDENRT